jgi:hypothetical protein
VPKTIKNNQKPMKKVISILVSVIFLTIVNSCYYDSEEVLYPKLSSQCDTSNVTYTGSISTIMSSYCTNCHGIGASGGLDLRTYEEVKAYANQIYGSMNHETGYIAMPKGGSKLDDCTLLQVKVWVDNSTPQ